MHPFSYLHSEYTFSFLWWMCILSSFDFRTWYIRADRTSLCKLIKKRFILFLRLGYFILRPERNACYGCYSFSQLFTHIFWKHASYSQNSTHKSKKNTHNGQNPSILLQNETLHSKQCYFFSKWDFVFKWHTQTIICVDIYKNQLNTDVLNVKHYDECKTLLLHSS